MGEILNNLPGVVCHVDDVLVSGKDQKEHDNRLHAVLKKIQAAGITLNREKCQFSRPRITFLGHIIDFDGISPDPSKTEHESSYYSYGVAEIHGDDKSAQ